VDIERLLETPDDFELCDQLFLRIVAHYGDPVDVSKCKVAERVVLLVWQTYGIVDNGGFQYLFEGTYRGDPHFAKTATAFQAIPARKCAEAVGDALRLFPDSRPPIDIKQRLKVYHRASGAKREAIDDKFFSESENIKTILAKYVRENCEEFMHLKLGDEAEQSAAADRPRE
jgi:hypothetical protein